MDLASRPELRYGTVDFSVPKAYWANNPSSLLDSSGLSTVSADLLSSLNEAVDAAATAATGSQVHVALAPTETKGKKKPADQADDPSLRPPLPIGRVFVIDVSWSAVRSGMLYTVCEGIRRALYGADGAESEGEEGAAHEVPAGRVAFITFDRAVHFYNLSVSEVSGFSMRQKLMNASPLQHEIEKAQMMVCPDVEDVFLPLARGFLVDPMQSKYVQYFVAIGFGTHLSCTERKSWDCWSCCRGCTRKRSTARSRWARLSRVRLRVSYVHVLSSQTRITHKLPIIVRLWRPTQRLPLLSAELGSGSAQIARGSAAVRYRQGKVALFAIDTLLAEYGRGIGRGWGGSQHFLVSGAIYRCGVRW